MTADGNFSHTANVSNAYVELDLGSNLPIGKVVIVNRSDGGTSRITGTTLSLRDASGVVVWKGTVIDTVGPIYRFTFPPTTTTPPEMVRSPAGYRTVRYVRLQRDTPTALNEWIIHVNAMLLYNGSVAYVPTNGTVMPRLNDTDPKGFGYVRMSRSPTNEKGLGIRPHGIRMDGYVTLGASGYTHATWERRRTVGFRTLATHPKHISNWISEETKR